MINISKKNLEKILPAALSAAGFILLPNLIFIVVALWLSVGRPYFNIDYAFAMLLAVIGQRFIGALLFIGVMLVDILALVSQVFPLPRLQDALYLISVAPLASDMFFILLIGATVLALANAVISTLLASRIQKAAALISFNLMLAAYTVHVYSEPPKFDRFYRVLESPLVSSQLKDFSDHRSIPFLWKFEADDEPLSPADFKGATHAWHETEAPTSLDDRILLIVNESWGVAVNPDIQEQLLAPLKALALSNVQRGDLEFSGATVSAELRELCKLQQNHLNLANATTGFEHCLPNNLKAAGYVTAAIHGAVSLMYDRKDWYPRAGLDERIFFETKVWPRRCYSFPGACDLDLMQEIPAFFSKSGKRFLYWLTLNSHSLYDKRDIKNDIFDCEAFKINKESESCRNLKLQAQFFAGLAEVLKAKEMQGIKVMIVGDHTPIIFNAQEKSANFVLNRVPWISFNTQK